VIYRVTKLVINQYKIVLNRISTPWDRKLELPSIKRSYVLRATILSQFADNRRVPFLCLSHQNVLVLLVNIIRMSHVSRFEPVS